MSNTTPPHHAPSHDNNLTFHNKNTNHLTPYKAHPTAHSIQATNLHLKQIKTTVSDNNKQYRYISVLLL